MRMLLLTRSLAQHLQSLPIENLLRIQVQAPRPIRKLWALEMLCQTQFRPIHPSHLDPNSSVTRQPAVEANRNFPHDLKYLRREWGIITFLLDLMIALRKNFQEILTFPSDPQQTDLVTCETDPNVVFSSKAWTGLTEDHVPTARNALEAAAHRHFVQVWTIKTRLPHTEIQGHHCGTSVQLLTRTAVNYPIIARPNKIEKRPCFLLDRTLRNIRRELVSIQKELH